MSDFEDMFKLARRRAAYWQERMELCETKKQRRSLSVEIAKMERVLQRKDK